MKNEARMREELLAEIDKSDMPFVTVRRLYLRELLNTLTQLKPATKEE